MLFAADIWCPPVFLTTEQFLCSSLPVQSMVCCHAVVLNIAIAGDDDDGFDTREV